MNMLHEHAMEKIVNPFVWNRIVEQSMLNPTSPVLLHETYAQCYEDVVVCQMIKAYAVRNNITEFRLSYVEIGANHPVSTSSSYLIHRTFGTHGILVEPNPVLAAELRRVRPNDHVIEAIVYDGPETEQPIFVGPRHELASLSPDHVDALSGSVQDKQTITVPTIHVHAVLDLVPEDVNYALFIDVEGMDWRILTSIDFTKRRPLFVQVEPSEDWYPGTVNRMVDFMLDVGYVLVAFNFVNLIFADKKTLP